MTRESFIAYINGYASLQKSGKVSALSDIAVNFIPDFETYQRLYNAKAISARKQELNILPPEELRTNLEDVVFQYLSYIEHTTDTEFTDDFIVSASDGSPTKFWWGTRATAINSPTAYGTIDPRHLYTAVFSYDSTAESFQFLKGKYFATNLKNRIYYIPENATISIVNDGSTKQLTVSNYKRVSNPGTYTQRFQSFPSGIDPNDSTILDNEEWRSLGNWQSLFAEQPIIRQGVYHGTAEYGEEHPNQLEFDFRPWFIIVYNQAIGASNSNTNMYVPLIMHANQTLAYVTNYATSGTDPIRISWDYVPWINGDLTTVSWYSTLSTGQQYNSNHDYYYIAFGVL